MNVNVNVHQLTLKTPQIWSKEKLIVKEGKARNRTSGTMCPGQMSQRSS